VNFFTPEGESRNISCSSRNICFRLIEVLSKPRAGPLRAFLSPQGPGAGADTALCHFSSVAYVYGIRALPRLANGAHVFAARGQAGPSSQWPHPAQRVSLEVAHTALGANSKRPDTNVEPGEHVSALERSCHIFYRTMAARTS